MKLTDKACKNAGIKDKPYKLTDGKGLYLLVNPGGSKCRRYKYRHLNREKVLALGVYPETSLAEAREKHRDAHKQVSEGIDPAQEKKKQKRLAHLAAQNTFAATATEWHSKQKPRWNPKHASNVWHKLETDIFPYIGDRPIAEIDAPELLSVLRKIENRGALDMAHRARGICGSVFRYGIATGLCSRDIAADLKGALSYTPTQHFAAIESKEIPEFLRTLETNEARQYARTRRAMKMIMLTFVRTSELIGAKWAEFDLDAREWHIPAERMKMKKPHIVPLSQQVIDLLGDQWEETGHFNTEWVFPSQIRPKQHMSNNTILTALKRIGYKGRMTGHGFRALAMSTIKEKLGYRHEVIDRQLAHGHRSKVTAAYDRAQFLDDRKKMMQDWADYLDSCLQVHQVIKVKFK
ncbi:MAG TPA: integrase arm-type DNA-binding domain-containing protein [Alphaproteobacteria bacterium]|nr:integrase arm-type DNA-binding domain-containing protein [Alphaproteobacteria bacterium]